MNWVDSIEKVFFGLCALLVLGGGVGTIAFKNPIRGAMGLLATIVGIAGMYLLLAAEFLAAIQILVYAGAVVVLFLFVIMLLGPSATSGSDTRGAFARYAGAGVFLATALGALVLLQRLGSWTTMRFAKAPKNLGTIEALGRELFTDGVVVFELSGALLLVAVVGAVAVARGKQVDPTVTVEKAKPALPPASKAVHAESAHAGPAQPLLAHATAKGEA
jgi:NADH-quinone oxidoreductase subunit J